MKTVRPSNPSQRGHQKLLIAHVCIDESDPKRCVGIGHDLDPMIWDDLITFLNENKNSFAWSSTNLRGISLEVTSHDLNVDPTYCRIKQKRRKLGPKRAKAVNDEVNRLLKIGSIREVKYPDWLANLVVVQKKNGKWNVCINFTDLNKACSKYSFRLPHMTDWSKPPQDTNYCPSWTHSLDRKILTRPNDQEKTAFITD